MTKKDNSILLFNEKQVRRHWDDERELWVFSVVDVIEILTESVDSNAYWRKLKERLKKEWNEAVTNCHGLKMKSKDWKMRITDEITKAWSWKSIKQYKQFKNLKKQNLRDNMTNLELVLNMLAEATTTEISKKKKPENFIESKKIAYQWWETAWKARKDIEQKIWESIISSSNARQLQNKKNKLLK
jgi:hypothetical protein